MSSPCLSLYTPPPPTSPLLPNFAKPRPNHQQLFPFNTTTSSTIKCKASKSSSSSITDYDLYDLLGVDSTSDHSQIKKAYRSLQKKCHPDIAGGPGHDMAIVLNEAYSVLSDPNSRFAYDKEQAKTEELKGYTGKPLYSVWMGPESEQRAVFVDELKCIGCLKCALFAEKTFAIESVYGRARVVAQWADPEPKIQEAIETCPVDCISMVDRSNLAALEFLMSKQPRGTVRMSSGNNGGVRVSNVFAEVNKFQDKVRSSTNKTSQNDSSDADSQREARISAIQAIRAISNWLYWQTPNAESSLSDSGLYLTHIARKSTTGPNIEKLQEAANALKEARANPKRRKTQTPSHYTDADEYWKPSNTALPATPQTKSNTSSEPSLPKQPNKKNYYKEEKYEEQYDPMRRRIPMGMAVMAAVIIRLHEQGEMNGGNIMLDEHVGGWLPLEIVNSSWLHGILAGVPWYFMGVILVELVRALQSKVKLYKK